MEIKIIKIIIAISLLARLRPQFNSDLAWSD